MRKTIFFLFLLLGISSVYGLDIQIETPYAVLMDAETGEVLYQKNAYSRIYPASTMKLATVLLALDKKGDLDDQAIVWAEALKKTSEKEKQLTDFHVVPYYLEPDGTMIYLRANERISFRSLMHAAMLKSANDACNVLASNLSNSIEEFVWELNEKMKGLGLHSTNFVNPHGLHHPHHYSCAYDMALLGRAAYLSKEFLELAMQKSYIKPRTNLQKEEKWRSFSCIINEEDPLYYSKALFSKTGQHKAAKFNLVTVATNKERTLVAALHKSPSWKQRYLDAIMMFEAAFNEEKVKRILFAKNETKFERKLPKADSALIAEPLEDIYLEYFPSQEPKASARLVWNDNLTLPIKPGDTVATIEIVTKDGKVIDSANLVSKNMVRKKQIFQLKWVFISLPLLIFIGAIARRYIMYTRGSE